MSSISLNGDTSGSIILAAPSVAGSGTLTLPTGTATLGIQGPAFSAYQSSNQTLSGGVLTKIQFQTEEFDTNNCFDSTTNYRFTPTVAGYYQVNACVASNGNGGEVLVAVYKNGSNYKFGVDPVNYTVQSTVNCLVYLNGSTDYIEIYGYFSTGQTTSAQSTRTWFQACFLRGA